MAAGGPLAHHDSHAQPHAGTARWLGVTRALFHGQSRPDCRCPTHARFCCSGRRKWVALYQPYRFLRPAWPGLPRRQDAGSATTRRELGLGMPWLTPALPAPQPEPVGRAALAALPRSRTLPSAISTHQHLPLLGSGSACRKPSASPTPQPAGLGHPQLFAPQYPVPTASSMGSQVQDPEG